MTVYVRLRIVTVGSSFYDDVGITWDLMKVKSEGKMEEWLHSTALMLAS